MVPSAQTQKSVEYKKRFGHQTIINTSDKQILQRQSGQPINMMLAGRMQQVRGGMMEDTCGEGLFPNKVYQFWLHISTGVTTRNLLNETRVS